MKITNIDVQASNSNNIINLSFKDPRSQNSYIAKEIIGLDADDIANKFYGHDLSNRKYYDLSLRKRDIVIKISLNPKFTIGESYSSLRDALYKFVSSSRTGAIQLQFKNGNTIVAAISGFITKFEAPNFTKTPEVQLTVNCSDSMLKAVEEINVDITGLDPTSTMIIDNESTAPHGFRFGVKFVDSIIDFSIQDLPVPNWAFELNLTGSPLVEFVTDDELHFSSEVNNRYVYLIRDFNIIHLVDRIIPTSIWPVLFPGSNDFVCSDLVVWDYITYYPTYWGI